MKELERVEKTEVKKRKDKADNFIRQRRRQKTSKQRYNHKCK